MPPWIDLDLCVNAIDREVTLSAERGHASAFQHLFSRALV